MMGMGMDSAVVCSVVASIVVEDGVVVCGVMFVLL